MTTRIRRRVETPLPLLVRTWNVFHGNAHPPRRRGFLREMVELAGADGPDVLCLQELPVWSLPLVDDWAGMEAARSIARRPFVLPGGIAGWITRRHQGFFRSGISGQANAILVARRHGLEDLGDDQISEDGRERRTVQAVRVAGRMVVANLHASNSADRALVEREVARALAFAESRARSGEPLVLAGDFNLAGVHLDGFSAPAAGVDHVLVRGLPAGAPRTWPLEARVQNGAVLSDHAPVEVEVG
jgi:endonuclease/exonuclease/phosphatase family metal-dependent hydrolase